jgi:hypothetical protein
MHCQASGSSGFSRGTQHLTGGNAYDKDAMNKAEQSAFGHIQEWDMCRLEIAQDKLTAHWEVLVPEGYLESCLEIGREWVMKWVICLNPS